MNNKSFDILLDIEKDLYTTSNLLFNVSRDDLNDIVLNFTIQQNGETFDLTGTTVEMAVKKPSGLTTYNTVTIQDAAAGTASILLGSQSYVEYGIYTSDLHIRTSDQMVVTCPFYYFVREAVMTTYDMPTLNDWSALQQALFAYDYKPILVDGVPTAVPEYIGQTAFDTTGLRAFMATGTTAADWMQLGASATGGTSVNWADILGKPATFPPSAHTHTTADITDFVTGVAANIPAEYLTETEANALYEPIGGATGGTAAIWGNITGTLADQTDLQSALDAKINTTDADARYQAIGTDTPDDWTEITNKPATFPPSAHTHTTADVTDFAAGVAANIPAEYLTSTEGDAAYQKLGVYDDWTEITGKPATFPPSAHQHTSADITDFATAVAADIPAEYLTQTEGDARYSLKGTTGTASSVDWGNITGTLSTQTDLQAALDAKANTTDIPDTSGLAPLASPALTGTPTAPTPAAGTNTTQIATTAFVAASTTGMLTQTDADARYQQIGTDTPDDWVDITNKPATFPPSAHTHAIADVTNLQTTLDAKAPLASPTFTGTPAAPTPAVADNSTALATTAFVKSQGYLTSAPATNWGSIGGTLANQTDLQAALDAKAPTASPALTGTPTAPTPAAGTNTTQIATTAFVQGAGFAPLASPTFTGTPAAPTPAAADNSTKLATTAFVQGQGFLKTVPLMSGSAIGGAQVGNGLSMSGNYLLVKTGASLGINGTTAALQVQDQNATPITFWRGTQAQYDAITTKDANTLYFISG